MPKLHEVIGGARDIEILVNSVPVQITYDPNEYTPEAEAIWADQTKSGTAGALAVDFLCRLLKYWDLEEDDSEDLIRIEPERLSKISLLALSEIMEGIFQDVNSSPGNARTPVPNRAARRASQRTKARAS